MNSSLPNDFINQMEALLGDQVKAFVESLDGNSLSSIRMNPYKALSEPVFEDLVPVKWHDSAFYLKERPIFTLDPNFHTGSYYVQEASSMFILKAIQTVIDMDHKALRILDLCAAPGGKTTLLSELGPQHLIVTNEVIKSRYQILNENLTRWGIKNLISISYDVDRLTELDNMFDIVLVDAPCSGEGLFRKDKEARNHWSLNSVNHCSARQKRILEAALSKVKEDGILIYSTCTYNSQENIEQVKWILESSDFESVQIPIAQNFQIEELLSVDAFGYQFYPHKLRGEGFFMSILKKTAHTGAPQSISKKIKSSLSRKELALLSELVEIEQERIYFHHNDTVCVIDQEFEGDLQLFMKSFRGQFGVGICQMKKQLLIPEHSLSQNPFIKHKLPSLELNKEQALRFLKKEQFDYQFTEKGWLQLNHNKIGLGWGKNLGKRMNNYLPKNLRIRMQIE